VTDSDDQAVVDYPFPPVDAIEPPAEWEQQVVLEVLLRRLPTLELAVAAEDLRPVEGLAVGGLREVPVRW
jgi:hypothetical protein